MATAFLILVTVVLLAAPILPLANPDKINTSVRLMPPFESSTNLLGTDQLGRDILSRLVWGGRVSLLAGLAAATISVGLGAALGWIGGYLGGWRDIGIMRGIEILMGFPPLVLAIAIVGALGPDIRNAVLAAGIVGIPLYARIIRGFVLTEREMDYVMAARGMGASQFRILLRHIAPATIPTISVLATLDFGYKIVVTAGLSFLGLGSQPPTSDWGAMLADGRQFLASDPHLVTIPGLAIFSVVLSLNLFGDGIRDMFVPREVKHRG